MDLGIQEKTALVMASSEGLGYAVARQLVAEGARVVMTSRSSEKIESAAANIRNEFSGAQILTFACDVSRAESLQQLFAFVEEKTGGADILVQNAGGPPAGDFQSMTEDSLWEKAFELTLMSFVRSVRLALPHMKRKQWGRIVAITSSSVKQPISNLVLSNVFRTGVVSLCKTLAADLAPEHILINAVGPGRIHTARIDYLDQIAAQRLGQSMETYQKEAQAKIPFGRYGTPEEFAAVVAFLVSNANGYTTGQSLLIDGGLVTSL